MKRPRHKKLSGRDIPKHVSVPFHREIQVMQMQYDRMISAIDGKDPAKVQSSACDLVLAWLQVEAAFIRFIGRTPAGLGVGPKAWRERLACRGSNLLVRDLFGHALAETSRWTTSPDELDVLRIILYWLQDRLQLCSVVGFPDVSSPHARHSDQPSTTSHRRAARTGVRK